MSKVRLSDFVVQWFVDKGIDDIFLVSGGGIMFLCDAIGKNRKIRYYSTHHEQACGVAAEAWARIKNKPGACLVTTGPGATNALTGIAGAYMDSVPLIAISGQVRSNLLADYSKQRQIGPQEGNTIETVRPNTKYAKLVLNPNEIWYELEKAYYYAMEGRPGPAWLDIPMDVQNAEIELSTLKKFVPPKLKRKRDLTRKIARVVEMLRQAKRPIIIMGREIRSSGAVGKVLDSFVKKIGAPIVAPYGGFDLIEEKNPLNMGIYGPMGQRKANFALQNSDLVLSIGTTLGVAAIGFNFAAFAPKAKKVMVYVDPGELSKKTIQVELGIESNSREFMVELLKQLGKSKLNYDPRWLRACVHWRKTYKNVIPEFFQKKNYVNPYVFYDKLSSVLRPSDTVVTGNSMDTAAMYQAFRAQRGQRAFGNANWGAMGWCLPGSIGAATATKHRIILVTGDGSIQFNIHELGTISRYKLPIKIFILNNDGYESIRTMQDAHFKSNYVGAGNESGVTNPNFKYLAKAYGIPYLSLKSNNDIVSVTKKVLSMQGPVIIEMKVDPEQHRVPKVSSFKRPDGTLESRPLEDMWPFLPREEILANMNMFEDSK